MSLFCSLKLVSDVSKSLSPRPGDMPRMQGTEALDNCIRFHSPMPGAHLRGRIKTQLSKSVMDDIQTSSPFSLSLSIPKN